MTIAIRAADFINTLGVQTHIAYSGQYSNDNLVHAALAYLNPKGAGTGIHTVREDTSAPMSRLLAMGALGYQFSMYLVPTIRRPTTKPAC